MNETKQDTPVKEITPEEKWKTATIANNFIFYKIMRHNPDVCKELLERLLEIEIDHIDMRGEETIETDFGSKGIRLVLRVWLAAPEYFLVYYQLKIQKRLYRN